MKEKNYDFRKRLLEVHKRNRRDYNVSSGEDVKQWVSLKRNLFVETDKNKIVDIINRMMEIGKAEIQNAEDTIPLVEADSRLGWEPSMEYMTDEYHLQWKIRQVRGVLEVQLPEYISALVLEK